MPVTEVNFCYPLPDAGRAGVYDMWQPCCHPDVAEEQSHALGIHLPCDCI